MTPEIEPDFSRYLFGAAIANSAPIPKSYSLVHNRAIVYISPAELVVHLYLIEIYGENEDRPDARKKYL